MASCFDRFGNSICQQVSKEIQQISKLANLTTRQSQTIVQSVKDMSFQIVVALGSPPRPVGGQPQNWRPPRSQALLTPNSHQTWNWVGSSGHVNNTHPLRRKDEFRLWFDKDLRQRLSGTTQTKSFKLRRVCRSRLSSCLEPYPFLRCYHFSKN